MATPARPLRVDDEVWGVIQALRVEYGTINAGLRWKFGLGVRGVVVAPSGLREPSAPVVPVGGLVARDGVEMEDI